VSVGLTLVTDRRRLAGALLLRVIGEAARAGLDCVQVREKDLGGRALRRLVDDVLAAVAGTATRVLVNGRPDVAEAAGAAGVQLPEQGLPVADVRRAFPALWIGASCHGLESAARAQADGADFVVLGPIFSTPGKEARPLGLEALAEAVRRLRLPVHAVGGIDAETAPRAAAAGAAGLLAIRAFLAGGAAEAVRALKGRGAPSP